MVSEAYRKDKVKRDFKWKEERTQFERALGEFLKQLEISNYLLAVIAMVIIGIFLRMVFG